MELKDLLDDQQYLVVDLVTEFNLAEVHMEITEQFYSLRNTPCILMEKKIYYLIPEDGCSFSLNEFKAYMDGVAVCYRVSTD